MARRRTSQNQTQRDFITPNQSLTELLSFRLRPPPRLIVLPTAATVAPALQEVGDRRLYRPDRSTRPPHSTRPGASRVVADWKSATTLRFADPAFVAICERRHQRRAVLFALRRTRKGSGASKRRNFWSNISC